MQRLFFFICTTEDMPGSGLGLRVSGTNTEKHMGKRVNSEMGNGLLYYTVLHFSILFSIIPIYYMSIVLLITIWGRLEEPGLGFEV